MSKRRNPETREKKSAIVRDKERTANEIPEKEGKGRGVEANLLLI